MGPPPVVVPPGPQGPVRVGGAGESGLDPSGTSWPRPGGPGGSKHSPPWEVRALGVRPFIPACPVQWSSPRRAASSLPMRDRGAVHAQREGQRRGRTHSFSQTPSRLLDKCPGPPLEACAILNVALEGKV